MLLSDINISDLEVNFRVQSLVTRNTGRITDIQGALIEITWANEVKTVLAHSKGKYINIIGTLRELV